jgi:hypothetical protein
MRYQDMTEDEAEATIADAEAHITETADNDGAGVGHQQPPPEPPLPPAVLLPAKSKTAAGGKNGKASTSAKGAKPTAARRPATV